MKRVVIVGGGITGLSAAYFLKTEAQKKGIDLQYTLVESKNKLGGNIETEKIDGFVIEGGPDCFISQKPWFYEMCKKLGIEDRLINTNEGSQTFVVWKNKLHPLPEGFILMIPTKIMPFLMSSLISIPGKLRMALDLVKPKGDPNKDESLGDFVTRRLGKEAMEKIAEPLVAGVHAGTPETMSLRSTYPRFLDTEQKYGSLIRGMLAGKRMAAKAPKKEGPSFSMFMSLKRGLIEIIEEIEKKLDRDSIITGKKVEKIEINKDDGNYIVKIEGKDPIKADHVIFSSPTYATADIIKDIDPSLAKSLQEIPYVSTATVSLAFKKSDIKTPLKGFGFVVPRTENKKIMAATWTSKKFPFRAPDDAVLIRCFVGGSKNEELAMLDENELIKIVKKDLKDIVKIDADPVLTKVFKGYKSMPQHVIGHKEKVKWIRERLENYPGLHLIGTAYEGIGLSDSIHAGELTANKILSSN